MTDDENGDYIVLINEEGQYSLWPAFNDVPNGWQVVGPRGNKKTCLDYVEANWTDMRPRSLVRHMERTAGGSGSSEASERVH